MREVVRDWALRFNAAGPARLIDCKAPGEAAKVEAAPQD
jgi:hypothetical protein